jgi:hypothetical protein
VYTTFLPRYLLFFEFGTYDTCSVPQFRLIDRVGVSLVVHVDCYTAPFVVSLPSHKEDVALTRSCALPDLKLSPASLATISISESPSCSITGTSSSSRSVSLYTNSSNRSTIQAYHRYDPALVNNKDVQRNHGSFGEEKMQSHRSPS